MRLIDAEKLSDDILHDTDYDNDTINHFIDLVDEQTEVDITKIFSEIATQGKMKLNVQLCHISPDGALPASQGLVAELNRIGYKNVIDILSCCPSGGFGEVYYTIIYKEYEEDKECD